MGRVVLIGAGPGAEDLITVRGLKLLMQADCVFYDALVHPDTIALAQSAQRVAVLPTVPPIAETVPGGRLVTIDSPVPIMSTSILSFCSALMRVTDPVVRSSGASGARVAADPPEPTERSIELNLTPPDPSGVATSPVMSPSAKQQQPVLK